LDEGELLDAVVVVEIDADGLDTLDLILTAISSLSTNSSIASKSEDMLEEEEDLAGRAVTAPSSSVVNSNPLSFRNLDEYVVKSFSSCAVSELDLDFVAIFAFIIDLVDLDDLASLADDLLVVVSLEDCTIDCSSSSCTLTRNNV